MGDMLLSVRPPGLVLQQGVRRGSSIAGDVHLRSYCRHRAYWAYDAIDLTAGVAHWSEETVANSQMCRLRVYSHSLAGGTVECIEAGETVIAWEQTTRLRRGRAKSEVYIR
jgi:hypothetical protein